MGNGAGRRVLITGIRGFTGHYVRAELETAGWEVIGTGTDDNGTDPAYRRCDLQDSAGLNALVSAARPHAVVHLAGIAFVGHGDGEAFYQVNLLGTRNLLGALASQTTPPERVLLVSSANVYGNAQAGRLDETQTPNPANDYAVSKLAMEFMARLWRDRLPITIARPFNYTGRGQSLSFVIPKLVDHFKRRAHVVELGNLKVEREFNDVRMVASTYRGLLDHGVPGEVYNVCTGRPHALQHVIDRLKAITGHDIAVRVNPAFVRANEVHRLCGDPGKLNKLAENRGFVVPDIQLDQTLEFMLAG
jgi:GDP-6-deoxy-D-talose 4-dehydrogenase